MCRHYTPKDVSRSVIEEEEDESEADDEAEPEPATAGDD